MNKNTKRARAAGYNNWKAFIDKDESQRCVKGRKVNSNFGSDENKNRKRKVYKPVGN